MNLAREDLCAFESVLKNHLWYMHHLFFFLPGFSRYNKNTYMCLCMACIHIKITQHQASRVNPAALLWSCQTISSALNVELMKAYHLHVSLKKMNLRRPRSAASNGCGTLSLCLSLSLFCIALLCCTLWYLQVLCGQVSCWNAQIGHLLRDKVY